MENGHVNEYHVYLQSLILYIDFSVSQTHSVLRQVQLVYKNWVITGSLLHALTDPVPCFSVCVFVLWFLLIIIHRKE